MVLKKDLEALKERTEYLENQYQQLKLNHNFTADSLKIEYVI